MASTISKLPSLEPFLNLITPTIRCQVPNLAAHYSSGSSSSDSEDDKDQSDLSSSYSGDDQEDSEVESESWTEELETFPAKYRKPARLSKHIRVGRVSGERRLPHARPATFDILTKTPTIFVSKIPQIKRLCDQSLDDRLTLIRRPPGFGKTSLLSMMINILDINHREEFCQVFPHYSPLDDDVLVLYLNLDNLSSDIAAFRASLIAYMNTALGSFLSRYRDLLDLNQHEINHRMYLGRHCSNFTWVMNLAISCNTRVVILIDNLNAPLMKSTEDNIEDIRSVLDRLLVAPIEAAIRKGSVIGGVAVASPLSHEPDWTPFPPGSSYRTHVFDNITIDRSESDVVNRCLGFTKSEISALTAERLPAEDVEPFVNDVVGRVDAFDSKFHLPRTYSMSGVLDELRKRTGQSASEPLVPLP
ncbi:hypothetical protein BDZ89DRAFT_1069416 [Hymenopellis radicata]|nr:hypothetical protein BDZ89DRAFT_1069416 [Hymenopellis radicata]